MAKINNGFDLIPASYLFAEAGKAAKERGERLEAEGKPNDVIKIAIGDPDIQTPAPIVQTLVKQRLIYRGYPDYEGIPELRQALSEYYHERFGVDMPASNIIVGDGAKSDLSQIALAFANIGDSVVLQDPAYPVYLNWSKFHQLNTHMIDCLPENNFFGPVPKEALDERLAIMWLCNPNNPTSAVASKEYLQQRVEECRKSGATLVHDIAYTDFRPGEEPPYAPSIFNVPGGEEVGFEVGSFSKPFSMTGDRLSWIATKNDELLQKWQKTRTNFDSGVPEYIQYAGVTALTDPDVKEIVAQNMAEYGKRADILRQGFQSIGCTVHGLGHGPYGWVQAPEGYSSKDFSMKVLEDARVATIWGSGFGKCGEGFIRPTVFQDTEKMTEAMDRVSRLKL